MGNSMTKHREHGRGGAKDCKARSPVRSAKGQRLPLPEPTQPIAKKRNRWDNQVTDGSD